ncbi:MAG: alpha/beta fold hydrolase [Cyanobacteriota bacterium]|nr:alpha/beta fold hydrolase [Cyanobacteriota bacterium]
MKLAASAKQKPTPPRYLRRYLTIAGMAMWLLLVGLGVMVWLLHSQGIINAWQFPLKSIAAFAGGGGLACFGLARIWGFWRYPRQQILRRIAGFIAIAFAILNLLAFAFAYGTTHFVPPGSIGFGLPRSQNDRLPTDFGLEYTVDRIQKSESEWLETWFIAAENQPAKGTVLLFPGQGGSKGKQLLAPAQVLHSLGYDALLVDFRGVGGSSGSTSTIGVREAKDVALAVDYARQLPSQVQERSPLILYGISMGSAAIVRAIARENVTLDAIVLELPFSRLIDAVKVRLAARRIPPFPLAELIVFWGGIQHGFNGFAHNPIAYARQVECPTLILHGEVDRWMSLAQIDELLANFAGETELAIFPDTGHQLLVTVDREFWGQSIDAFLDR